MFCLRSRLGTEMLKKKVSKYFIVHSIPHLFIFSCVYEIAAQHEVLLSKTLGF